MAAAQYRSKQIERLSTCPICLDKFRIPKVLPCMHTFCLTPCLTNLIDPRARSFRCPECRREHAIPPGGVQSFPSNATTVAFPDIQPSTNIDFPDRCFICKQPKQTLIQCQDCSKYICTNCREPHIREAFSNVSSSVNQLRRTLPNLSNRIVSSEQRVNNVKTNYEQIRREITSNIATVIDELKHREATLLTEAEAYMQSQLRTFRIQQEPTGVELASVTSFCDSVGRFNPNQQIINDTDIANIRSQCNRFSQQIDALQGQTLPDTQKLRLTFDNRTAISSSIQDFGRLTDMPQGQQQQPRFSQAAYPQTATNYVATPQNSGNNRTQTRNDQYRQQTSQGNSLSYRPTQNHNSGFDDNPFTDLSATLPARTNTSSYNASWNQQSRHRSISNVQQSSSVFGSNPFAANNSRGEAQQPPPSEASPRRNYVTSTTAARSLEGDDRPIFGGRGGAGGGGGGGGRGRGRLPTIPSIQEHEPLTNGFQRSNTFALDEPTLPNLPQSGAQKPRDTVNVRELYNVKRKNRARTPVAFTVNLNEPSQSRASSVIDNGTI